MGNKERKRYSLPVCIKLANASLMHKKMVSLFMIISIAFAVMVLLLLSTYGYHLYGSTRDLVDKAVPNVMHLACADSTDIALRLLRETGVCTIPGDAFGASCRNALRISYSTSLDQIEKAFERMTPWLDRQSF